MIRALEHFTRVLFTGGQSDLFAQFLYADLSSSSVGAPSFSPHLSEEDLNGLLCGVSLDRVRTAAPWTKEAVDTRGKVVSGEGSWMCT